MMVALLHILEVRIGEPFYALRFWHPAIAEREESEYGIKRLGREYIDGGSRLCVISSQKAIPELTAKISVDALSLRTDETI